MVKTWDAVVIGSGYWGAGIAAHLADAGKSVLVVDDGDAKSGSRNASAICDPAAYESSVFKKYWPPDWDASDLDYSLNWLLAHGGRKVRENFWNRFAGTAPRDGAEAIYLDCPEPLMMTPRSVKRAARVVGGESGFGGVTVEFDYSTITRTRQLVVAAGRRTDEVLTSLQLKPVGVRSLFGRGIVARGTPVTDTPVSVMIAPYRKHTVRDWPGGLFKVGDTAEEKPNDKKLEDLRTVGRAVLAGYEEVQLNEGYRPVMDRFTVEKVAPNVVVATGGHRLGLGLAGLVGRKTLEALR